MTSVVLRADCTRCAALCCVAPAFDQSPEFAYDKPAGAACRHLGGDDRCGLYGRREAAGFSGCVGFDCLGAGQRIVQELFAGRSWRDDPDLLAEMSRCFFVLRQVHELLLLLGAAAGLGLSRAEREELTAIEAILEPGCGWSPGALLALDLDRVGRRARSFLATLRPHVERPDNKKAAPEAGAADTDRREGRRSAVLL